MGMVVRRLHVLLAVLIGAGALVALAPAGDEGVPVSAAASRPRATSASSMTSAGQNSEGLLTVSPRLPAPDSSASAAHVDIFANRSLPPPAAVLAPAPIPQAASAIPPSVPFNVIGKKLQAGTWEVYVMRGDTTFVARQGERLDSVYTVDSIAPPLMTLTYLPLRTVQTLQIGEAP